MMNLLEKLIIKFCIIRIKSFLNMFGYGTPYLCKTIINNIKIPYCIYKYQLIALSYFTAPIDIDTRKSIILSLINYSGLPQLSIINYSDSRLHKSICIKFIYYLIVFPEYINVELNLIYEYLNWHGQFKYFSRLLNFYFSKDKVNKILSQFLLIKLL